MSYTVYGLRLKTEKEVRYVGQTSGKPITRLAGHFATANAHVIPTSFTNWLLDNRSEIEAFPIAKVETQREARATEQVIIGLCLRLNHRLFNRHGVPADLRIAKREAA